MAARSPIVDKIIADAHNQGGRDPDSIIALLFGMNTGGKLVKSEYRNEKHIYTVHSPEAPALELDVEYVRDAFGAAGAVTQLQGRVVENSLRLNGDVLRLYPFNSAILNICHISTLEAAMDATQGMWADCVKIIGLTLTGGISNDSMIAAIKEYEPAAATAVMYWLHRYTSCKNEVLNEVMNGYLFAMSTLAQCELAASVSGYRIFGVGGADGAGERLYVAMHMMKTVTNSMIGLSGTTYFRRAWEVHEQALINMATACCVIKGGVE
jgi:hypothetical protein